MGFTVVCGKHGGEVAAEHRCVLCMTDMLAENAALRKVAKAAREASLAYATMTCSTKMHELAEALRDLYALDSTKRGGE